MVGLMSSSSAMVALSRGDSRPGRSAETNTLLMSGNVALDWEGEGGFGGGGG